MIILIDMRQRLRIYCSFSFFVLLSTLKTNAAFSTNTCSNEHDFFLPAQTIKKQHRHRQIRRPIFQLSASSNKKTREDVTAEAEAALKEAELAFQMISEMDAAENNNYDFKSSLVLSDGVKQEQEVESKGPIMTFLEGAVTSVTDSVASSIQAIPGKIKGAVDRKVEETAEEIKQIPNKVKDAAIEAAMETAEVITDEVKKIPNKVKDAAIQKAQDAKAGIEAAAIKAVEDAVEEVKATPGRVAITAKEAVKTAAKKAVEEAKAAPGKVVQGTKNAVTKVVDNALEPFKKKTGDNEERID